MEEILFDNDKAIDYIRNNVIETCKKRKLPVSSYYPSKEALVIFLQQWIPHEFSVYESDKKFIYAYDSFECANILWPEIEKIIQSESGKKKRKT